jgi:hypothetical protein
MRALGGGRRAVGARIFHHMAAVEVCNVGLNVVVAEETVEVQGQ